MSREKKRKKRNILSNENAVKPEKSDVLDIDDHENTLKPGEKIGKYEIWAVLGSGSMGTVYKVHDTKLERTVALKTINNLTEKSCAKFEEEGRNMAQCDHENIIKIYETNIEPIPHIVMEYVEGVTLGEWGQKLSKRKGQKEKETEIVKVFIQLGEALQEIHKHKLMHLDIKPGNIMMTKKNKPKLMDFGISQKIKEFVKGTVAGTPYYMALEQAKGEATAKSDIYALGATLYEVVTGYPPFYEQKANSMMNLLFKVITHEPRRLRNVNPEVSTEIEAICLKCMHKDEEKRYVSAKQFTRDLNNFLKSEPLLANKLNFWEKKLLFVKKHRFICAFLALAITSAIVSTILAVTINKHRNEIYEQNKLIVSQNEKITNQNYEYGKISTKYYSNRGQIFQRYAEDALENNESEDDILAFYQNALESYQKSIKTANDIGFQYAKPFNYIFSLSINRELLPEHLLQKNTKILERFQKIAEANPYECLKQAIVIDSHYSEAYFNMGLWYENRGKIREAIEHFTKAINCIENESKTYEEDCEDNRVEAEKRYKQTREDSFFNRGVLYEKLNELPKALADYNQVILLNNKYDKAFFNRGVLYEKLNELPKALADYNQVILLNNKYDKAFFNRGVLYEKLNELPKALADYNQAILLNNNKFADAYCNRGVLYEKLNELPKALADYNQAILLNNQFADAYFNRAIIYYKQKQDNLALQDCETVLVLNPNYKRVRELKNAIIKRGNK